MGFIFSKLHRSYFCTYTSRVLILGLDRAGKTTILFRFKLGQQITTIPTIGFNVQEIKINDHSFTVWDVGGQDQIRHIWKHYYQNVNCIIYVVDSSDKQRMETAREELHRIMIEEELSNSILLVLANKQDLSDSMSVSQVAEELGLQNLKHRKWNIVGTCGKNGKGVQEGLSWISETLNKKP